MEQRYDHEVAYWCGDCCMAGHMDIDDAGNGCPVCGNELSIFEDEDGGPEA